MAPILDKLASNLDSMSSGEGSNARNRALVTGSLAVGALLAGTVLNRMRADRMPRPSALAPALEADLGSFELMEGSARYYVRAGKGTPVVLLHSINAAASSFEMKPVFEHFVKTTSRPVYALDWFGFGRSERPSVAYGPDLYRRQLRRFLSEIVFQPADVVALSLGGEYAASVAETLPFLFRRLTLISPTALGASDESSTLQRFLVEFSGDVGLFEIFFHRLTRPSTLRRFYAEQVFLKASDVPDELVENARLTSNVRGASFAPQRFVQGDLFLRAEARQAYGRLRLPTLLVVPDRDVSSIQTYERLPEVVASNGAFLKVERLHAGLLPQWDRPDLLLPLLDEHLAE